MIQVQVEMIPRAYASVGADTDASERGKTARVARARRINSRSSFVFQSCVLVVRAFPCSGDKVLKDVFYLLRPFRGLQVVDALRGVSTQRIFNIQSFAYLDGFGEIL